MLFDKKINKLVRNYIFMVFVKITETLFFIISSLYFFIIEKNKKAVLNFLIDFIIISLLNLVEVHKLFQFLKKTKSKINILRNTNNSLTTENLKKMAISKIITKYENNFISNKKNIKKSIEIICTICQEKIIANNCSLTSCNHYFHSTCLCKWIIESESCPLCRNNIFSNHANNIGLQII